MGSFYNFFFNVRIQITLFIDFHRNLFIELTGNHNLVIINRDTAKQFMVYCFQFYCNFFLTNMEPTKSTYLLDVAFIAKGQNSINAAQFLLINQGRVVQSAIKLTPD